MLVRAIINISGRYTEYDMIYWIVSGLLFAVAGVLYLRRTVGARPALLVRAGEYDAK